MIYKIVKKDKTYRIFKKEISTFHEEAEGENYNEVLAYISRESIDSDSKVQNITIEYDHDDKSELLVINPHQILKDFKDDIKIDNDDEDDMIFESHSKDESINLKLVEALIHCNKELLEILKLKCK
jgi:hypothetical protein